MAQDNLMGITEGLFGVRPATFDTTFANALPALHGMNAVDIGTAAAYAGGKGLTQGLAGMLGVPSQEEAASAQARQFAQELIAQGVNMNSSQGMKMLAQKLTQAGDFRGAQLAATYAADFESKEAATELKKAQAIKAAREPRDTMMQQITTSGKYTPASIAAYQQSGNVADLVLSKTAAGGEGEGVGPVGKTGAYRNAFGEIIPGSEMSKQRAGFQKGEQLLDNLNKITKEDITQSESWVDWTSGENKKQIGGKIASKTVGAQARINAAQLLKQIESLPPGSASNADMAAAKSSFPGYGDAVQLEKWVTETKAQLADSLARQSEQYGFNQRVQVKPLSGGTGGAGAKKRVKFNEM
jgi:hypothetical protein